MGESTSNQKGEYVTSTVYLFARKLNSRGGSPRARSGLRSEAMMLMAGKVEYDAAID